MSWITQCLFFQILLIRSYHNEKDYSYYFVDKLIDIDTILVNLIQNRRITSNLKNNLKKLRYMIKNNYELIRYKQMKNNFLKLMSQKLDVMINGNHR